MAFRTLVRRLALAVAVAALAAVPGAPARAIGLPKAPTPVPAPAPVTAAAVVPHPVVEGPITGGLHGHPWFSTVVDLAPYGYVEQEFFVSGTSDQQTPFKTRIVVRRPTNPAAFSGTVFAEWVNVTGGQDLETLWPAGHPVILGEGHAYVAISAQRVGVEELVAWDPVRYGTLNHPGDDPHSFRILEQCIQAIRSPSGVDPMGGLHPQYIIVAGDSQSASRITSYIEQGYENEGLIDAWIPGRGGTNAFVKQVMEELHMPLINLLEENQAERPADSTYYRVFQGAGQAHAPYDWHSYVWAANERDLLAGAQTPDPVDVACRGANGGTGGMNRSYSRMMVRAGIHWINRMVRGQGSPPIQPRLVRDGSGNPVRNADGYPMGGIRYPDVQVPIGLNTSETVPLFGIWDPWTAEEIIARYPTKAIYLQLTEDAIAAMTPSGVLLPADADEARDLAESLNVWDGPQARACYNESWGFPPDPLNPCLTLP